MLFSLLRSSQVRWRVCLLGQFLLVFAVVALSGPGRIDIVDGQTRYEAARGFIDHGDFAIRDPHVYFAVFPGRDGQLFTSYRLPHTAAAIPALWLADATGPVSEGRRHFYFTLVGAVACALLAVMYTIWFRYLGHTPLSASLWAILGIVCTQSWFYGTSTFDDILGAAVLVAAVAVAHTTRKRLPHLGVVFAGLLIGLAFNCKQPLGIFVLAVLAANYDPGVDPWGKLRRVALVLPGMVLGLLVYLAYEWYKFPPGTTAEHAAWMAQYGPRWVSNPLPGLLSLTISPGAGILVYCPTIILTACGFAAWYRSEKRLCWMVFLASFVFVIFVSFLAFCKGDPTWGPRYLTPILALMWIFVPAATRLVRKRVAFTLVGLGLVVQLLSLSVDPQRLYLQRVLPNDIYYHQPWIYFDPAVSHLCNRPREIVELLTRAEETATAYTPAATNTHATPPIPTDARGAIWKYHVFAWFRPWCLGQWYLAPAERPVDLGRTLGFLSGVGLLGLVFLAVGCRSPAQRQVTVKRGQTRDLKEESAVA